jgi:hypothetical protein
VAFQTGAEGPVLINIRVTATRRGLNAVTSKLAPDVLYDATYESLQDTLDEYKRILVNKIPIDTGQTAGNIFTAIEGSTMQDLSGVVASPDFHMAVLEFGRRAGARMPPAAPLEAWCERHGIDSSAVFAIRRAIGRRGLPAHHYMQKTIEEGRKHFSVVWFRRFVESWQQTYGTDI